MNKFIGLARLGRDAETRYTANGTAVASFAAAVDVGYGQNKSTLWLDCALFGKRAEGNLVQYLTKGTQCIVEGEINLRQFQKQDGSHGAAVTLNVQDLKLVGGQPDSNQPRQQAVQPQPQPTRQAQPQPQASQPVPGGPGPVNDFDDDIPFMPLHWLEG